MSGHVTALLADDEPLLLESLERALGKAWPALQVVARCSDGESAVRQALALQPALCFLDVRMPGLSGIEVATALADEWPSAQTPFPLIVFVTAYDQDAMAAFDAQAADYLLKPLDPQRLAQSVARLQMRCAERSMSTSRVSDAQLLQMAQALARLHREAVPVPNTLAPTAQPLRHLQVSQGNTLYVIPISDVIAIEAADRYLRIFTSEAEHLIRTPLRELQARLLPDEFWQIHRSVLVRASAIARLQRDDAGKLSLALRNRPETWTVSRLYAAQFKAM